MLMRIIENDFQETLVFESNKTTAKSMVDFFRLLDLECNFVSNANENFSLEMYHTKENRVREIRYLDEYTNHHKPKG